MNTGHNPMSPLSDFTVTFVDHTIPKVVKVEWAAWERANNWPDYDLYGGYKLCFHKMKKPEGIEIIMPPNNPPYELIWAT